ncbi:MAG: hypothetical protein JNL58_20815 [Planctomyces sp.]|nr:hypothetical protein [Planctomyces sp.]
MMTRKNRALAHRIVLALAVSCSAGLNVSASQTNSQTETVTDTVPVEQASPAEQSWELRYQFQPGQTLRYKTHQTVTTVAMASNQQKTDESTVEQTRLFTVDQVDTVGTAHLAMQFERVWMQVRTNNGQPVVFDATMKAEEVPAIFRQTADRLRGSAAKYHLLSNGRVANPAKPDAKPDSQKELMAPSFLMALPDQPVRVGDTWKDIQLARTRVTKDLKRDIQILQTFRLDSVENGIATISFNSSIESPVSNPSIQAQLIQSTPKGTLRFDINRGIMLEKKFRFDESVLNALGSNSLLNSHGSYTEEFVESASSVPAAEQGLSAN